MIKLVAIDLDGTLLNNDRVISEKNKQAIKKANKMGIKVVICTGRPLLSVTDILKELDLQNPEDYVITYNGGLVQHAETGEIISQQTLTKEEAIDLYELSKKISIPCNLIDLKNIYELPYPNKRQSWYGKTKPALPFVPVKIEEFNEKHTFNKVIYCFEPETLDKSIADIPPEYFEKYSCVKSRPILFEMMKKDVTKATGISALCNLLSIQPNEVMALGDEENDLSMIQFAGIGVAMENAAEAVKREADFLTKTNNNHGVAHAMEKFIFHAV